MCVVIGGMWRRPWRWLWRIEAKFLESGASQSESGGEHGKCEDDADDREAEQQCEHERGRASDDLADTRHVPPVKMYVGKEAALSYAPEIWTIRLDQPSN